MAANLGFDEVIVGLESMGFELNDCQKAIDAGHTTIEAAVEWLIQKKTNVAPPEDNSRSLARGSLEEHQATSSPSIEQSTTREMTGGDMQVSSRYAMSDETRQAKDNFFKKERDSARIEAKKRKLEGKKAKEVTLKQIADDKEMRKNRGIHKAVSPPPPPASVGIPVASSSKPGQDVCMLQLRLPGGQVRKVSLAADTKLEDAVMSACTDSSIRIGEFEVVQPFPHRVFSQQEMASSLREVGLHPSGSVVVRKLQHTPSSTVVEGSDRAMDVQSSTEDTARTLQEPAIPEPIEVEPEAQVPLPEPQAPGPEPQIPDPEPPAPHPEAPAPYHEDQAPRPDPPAPFGRADGHLPLPGAWVAAGNNDDDNDDHDIPGPGNFPVMPGMPRLLRHQWGEGVRLGAVPLNVHAPASGAVQAESPEDSPARRAEMRAQCLQRLSAGPSHPEEPLLLHREVTRLEELCINNVCRRLAGHRHLQPLAMLGVLPHDVCDKLIVQLIKDKALTPKTINAFLSCCLRYIKLDCYLLVTNELLSALRFHRHLTHLSLKSCPIITDKALEAVSVLKRLQSLNISQCTQLTDKCFTYIKDLPALSVLQMDNTKVTDNGVTYFMSYASCVPYLIQLSLCSTAVSDDGLQSLEGLKSVRILGLENTKITSFDVVCHLHRLESLNVSHTGVTDESLAVVHGHPSLTSLNILATSITDNGLQHLQGLALRVLKLPGRLNITDQGITKIQGIPLLSLDLSDYINVTDRGVLDIGHMTSLTKLTLSNTRLTDEGMAHLAGLTNLVELNVDRTVTTDKGCEVVANFPELQVLSLSSTRVSDKFLRRRTLNQCIKLCQLNLSRTGVSNKGIKHLELDSLTLLNLDWTRVTTDCKLLLTGCPSLKALRNNNCTPPRPGDSSDSEEEM